MDMELRPSQKQTVTHQMIQSSEILQMNNMELEIYLQNLALENPLLDFEEPPEEDERKKEWLNRMKSLPLLGTASQKLLHALQQKYGSADYNALDDEMKKTFVRVVSEDLRPCLEHIQAPTLLVWGEHDDATPLWMGKTMAQEIPDAGLVVFEGQDHFAYLREWPRFVTIVKAFLN